MPIFMSEIMPAPIRGITVGSYQFSLVVCSEPLTTFSFIYLFQIGTHRPSRTDPSQQTGGLIVNCIARGTSTMTTNAAWRIPMGLFFVVPTIIIGCVWFIPEVCLKRPARGFTLLPPACPRLLANEVE